MNRILGLLYGGAIGDALGYQIEFQTNIRPRQITSYVDGIFSDDTQMSLFTAYALTQEISVESIYNAYLDWLDTQEYEHRHVSNCWLKNIDALNVRRAPGMTCLSALQSGKMGTINHPINHSKGCGGLMRVAPIGLVSKTAKEAALLGAKASAITHGHPLAIMPAYVLCAWIWYISHASLDLRDSLDQALDLFEQDFQVFDNEDVFRFNELIYRAIQLVDEEGADPRLIQELGEGWVGEEALAIAIYACLKYSNSFSEAVICGVNHDGDSDSTGAIVGNVMGAYLGAESIPDKYLRTLECKDVMERLSKELEEV